jgi:hypothetical protein
MFFSTCKWIIISLTLIFLIHYLYIFLMNTLTVPKLKDLVNKPTEQYKDIFASLQQASTGTGTGAGTGTGTGAGAGAGTGTGASTGTGTGTHSEAMTNELANFLKDLKKPPLASNGILASNEMPMDKNGFSSY